ncbi:MAG TPA: hypothetical protein PLN69_07355 [bacterium]|nr:hypothetical protein [bacterium]
MVQPRLKICLFITGFLVIAIFSSLISGCGGAALPVAGGTIIAGNENGKDDNPLFAVPLGHPNRIIFVSDRSSGNGEIYTTSEFGGETIRITTTPEESTRSSSFSFLTPGVSQDGLKVYFASDWYATKTILMNVTINGVRTEKFYEGDTYLETPRSSWDGTRLAFSGYTITSVLETDTPSNAVVTEFAEYGGNPEVNAQIGMAASGWKMIANHNSIAMKKANAETDCSSSAKYASEYLLADSDGATMSSSNNPTGKYFCINIDNSNYIFMQVSAYTYSADMATSGTPGSMTFTWKWIGHDTDMSSPITLTGDASANTGQGYNFLIREYDIYTSDANGENVVKHTGPNSSDDPERYPCFSPESSDFVYFVSGSLYHMDYSKISDSNIYKMNISTGQSTQVTDSGLIRNCAFSPSGRYLTYSYFNGSDYDIYLYDTTTSESSLVADTGGDDLNPVFSPTGNKIAFDSNVTTDTDIYTVEIDGDHLTNITDNYDQEDFSPVWAP